MAISTGTAKGGNGHGCGKIWQPWRSGPAGPQGCLAEKARRRGTQRGREHAGFHHARTRRGNEESHEPGTERNAKHGGLDEWRHEEMADGA